MSTSGALFQGLLAIPTKFCREEVWLDDLLKQERNEFRRLAEAEQAKRAKLKEDKKKHEQTDFSRLKLLEDDFAQIQKSNKVLIRDIDKLFELAREQIDQLFELSRTQIYEIFSLVLEHGERKEDIIQIEDQIYAVGEGGKLTPRKDT